MVPMQVLLQQARELISRTELVELSDGGVPDTPVIFTALGDDSIGSSLNALGLPVNDTNVNRFTSEDEDILLLSDGKS